MRAVRAGGFTPASAVATPLDLADTYCAFCFHNAEHGWLHMPSQRLVCVRCLRDPDAEGGAAGRRAAERVMALDGRCPFVPSITGPG